MLEAGLRTVPTARMRLHVHMLRAFACTSNAYGTTLRPCNEAKARLLLHDKAHTSAGWMLRKHQA